MVFIALSFLAAVLNPGLSAQAREITSPFPSTVSGLTIPNAHVVARKEGEVLRGMRPERRVKELVKHGITDVLIFRNSDVATTTAELKELNENGFSQDQIHHIPFKWRGITNDNDACEQVVEALKILEWAYTTPGKSLFFHCTVGEDRTGLLAGLFRLVEQKNNGWDLERAFRREMCLNGYSSGNPRKPRFVVEAVDTNLTPLFLKLAELVQRGKLAAGRLDKSVCAELPKKPAAALAAFRCDPSPRALVQRPRKEVRIEKIRSNPALNLQQN